MERSEDLLYRFFLALGMFGICVLLIQNLSEGGTDGPLFAFGFMAGLFGTLMALFSAIISAIIPI